MVNNTISSGGGARATVPNPTPPVATQGADRNGRPAAGAPVVGAADFLNRRVTHFPRLRELPNALGRAVTSIIRGGRPVGSGSLSASSTNPRYITQGRNADAGPVMRSPTVRYFPRLPHVSGALGRAVGMISRGAHALVLPSRDAPLTIERDSLEKRPENASFSSLDTNPGQVTLHTGESPITRTNSWNSNVYKPSSSLEISEEDCIASNVPPLDTSDFDSEPDAGRLKTTASERTLDTRCSEEPDF